MTDAQEKFLRDHMGWCVKEIAHLENMTILYKDSMKEKDLAGLQRSIDHLKQFVDVFKPDEFQSNVT